MFIAIPIEFLFIEKGKQWKFLCFLLLRWVLINFFGGSLVKVTEDLRTPLHLN